MRTIALEDFVYYLRGSLDHPRSFQQRFYVVLSVDELINRIADIIGGPRPRKIKAAPALLGTLAPINERIGKLPADR